MENLKTEIEKTEALISRLQAEYDHAEKQLLHWKKKESSSSSALKHAITISHSLKELQEILKEQN